MSGGSRGLFGLKITPLIENGCGLDKRGRVQM